MAAPAIPVEMVTSFNPATGEVLKHIEATPSSQIPAIVKRARAVQTAWKDVPLRERLRLIGKLRELMLARQDELADTVVRESGKPRVEARFADVFVALDTAAYFASRGEVLLSPERIPHHSTAAKAKTGKVYYEPASSARGTIRWRFRWGKSFRPLQPGMRSCARTASSRRSAAR